MSNKPLSGRLNPRADTWQINWRVRAGLTFNGFLIAGLASFIIAGSIVLLVAKRSQLSAAIAGDIALRAVAVVIFFILVVLQVPRPWRNKRQESYALTLTPEQLQCSITLGKRRQTVTLAADEVGDLVETRRQIKVGKMRPSLVPEWLILYADDGKEVCRFAADRLVRLPEAAHVGPLYLAMLIGSWWPARERRKRQIVGLFPRDIAWRHRDIADYVAKTPAWWPRVWAKIERLRKR